MNELVFKGQNDQVLTNSLLVAEKFGKEHKNVLSSIRELIKGCAENAANLMFEETTYKWTGVSYIYYEPRWIYPFGDGIYREKGS